MRNLNAKNDMTADDLFELAYGYWKSCAFHTGVKLDIFTAIGNEQMTAAQVAEKQGLNERASGMLLTALTSLNLLERNGDKFSNTRSGERLLSKDSPNYAGYMALHHSNIISPWTSLHKSIITGQPVEAKETEGQDGHESWWEVCIHGMISLSLDYASEIAKTIDLSKCRSMLDFGGGPGVYSVNFCLSNPRLKATVYDLELTKPIAEKTIKKFGVEKQVSFKGGNYRKDTFEPEYDVVWMSHIIHSEGPKFCQELVNKAVSAVKAGGQIMVHDYYLNDEMDGPVHPALFSLNMLLLTRDGQSYSKQEVCKILEDAGVKNLRFSGVRGQLESGIITGDV